VVERLLLTPAEAATALSIGRSKLYELMRRRRALGADRRCRRITTADLSDVVAKLKTLEGDAA